MVLSSELEASVRPSGENATSQTPPVWPRRNITFVRAVTSHKPTLPSQLALASNLLSGEKASAATVSEWPRRTAGGPGWVVLQNATWYAEAPAPGARSPTPTSVWPSGEIASRIGEKLLEPNV